jgi:PhoH-like ATPase
MKKKIFVLDTNVILHDSSCLDYFEEHDVIIPITVLEELDNFKKGNRQINFNARQFVRTIDQLSGANLLNGGVSLGEDRGILQIKLEKEQHDKCKEFPMQKADHHILNIACHEQDERPDC